MFLSSFLRKNPTPTSLPELNEGLVAMAASRKLPPGYHLQPIHLGAAPYLPEGLHEQLVQQLRAIIQRMGGSIVEVAWTSCVAAGEYTVLVHLYPRLSGYTADSIIVDDLLGFEQEGLDR